MAEVRQIPGKVFVKTEDDGEAKQIPGKVFFIEETAATGTSLVIPTHGLPAAVLGR